jgi:hypothetical protein
MAVEASSAIAKPATRRLRIFMEMGMEQEKKPVDHVSNARARD